MNLNEIAFSSVDPFSLIISIATSLFFSSVLLMFIQIFGLKILT